ncbi:hypothetical protein RHGRI_012432 [Rhododendron griersonianum]|uniref:F-box domain-containing protein n=1 Tax=Rhododendron griersonianum TaxID=479676 RepID=A0AAV6KRM3_9ERIC|nr:hypothetical protein RHGRI_012432 [Rhododendron griersonianum]
MPNLSPPPHTTLPDEIISDILSRLPVVSLCRFRCVSKSWRSLISHPHFITTHLNRSTNSKHERLILGNFFCNLYSVELDSSQFRHQSLAVHLDFAPDQNPSCCDEIGGSCDGLVLMLDVWFNYSLVNPSTRESRELPESPFTIEGKFFADYGLGYDSSIDDYKVVNISYHHRETESADNLVSVYALKTNSWRRIENSPYDHSHFEHQSGAFVCGALHWVASNGMDDVIVALGLADEKFRTVSSPALGCTVDQLCVLGGCLCVFVEQFYDPGCLDAWVMKEYGVRDSWTKFTVTCDNRYESWRPLSLSRTGQFLFNVEGYKLVLFDTQEKESKELMVHGRPAQFEAGTYVESLVSPTRLCY